MKRPSPHKLAIVGSALLGLCACAQTRGPPPGEPTPQAVSMKGAFADVARVRAYIYGGGDQADAAAAAGELGAFAKGLPSLFPPGTASNEYLDMSPARVSAAPKTVAETVQTLSTAIATGERTQVAEALQDLERRGCGACHRPAAVPNT